MEQAKAEVNGHVPFESESVDLKQTKPFLRAIDGTGEKDPPFQWALIQQKPDHPKKGMTLDRYGTLAELDEWLETKNLDGFSPFICPNKTDGSGNREMANMTEARALWNDCDHGVPEIRDYPADAPPTMRAHTSPGKVQDHWVLEPGMSFVQQRSCLERMVADYGCDPAVKNANRVLRVPGFFNWKYGKPHLVTLEKVSLKRYEPEDITQAFPPVEKKHKQPPALNGIRLPGVSGFGEGFRPEEVERALAALPIKRFKDRVEWMKVIQAVHYGSGGSDEGFALVREWSAGDPDEFDEDALAKLWNSLSEKGSNEEPVKLGTLFHTAKEHGLVLSPNERLSNLDEVTVEDSKTASEFGLEVDTWTDDATAEFFSRMNREHALVCMGSSIRYLHARDEPNGERSVHFLQPDSMKRLYANISVPVGERKLNGFDAWDRWKERRQCTGVGRYPGSMPVPPGRINLWRGFAIEPRKGRWNLFHDHLHNVVCSGSDEIYFWLIDWLAHLFQHPDEKPGSAVVLKSEAKGTGKSMVFQFLRRILGVHAMNVSQASHVVGNFNGHLLQNILLGVEEAFWAGNKSAEGVIKSLITEPTITIEQKGIDPISAPNFTRLLINSNESWTVPVGMDERRFLVLEVNNPRAKDRTCFDPIFDQMLKEGGLAAMLYSLLDWKIESDLRNPPETKALEQEREFSLDGVHKWMCEVARSGCVRNIAHNSEIELSEKRSTEIDRTVVREAARYYCASYEGRALDTRLGLLLKRVGVRSSHPRQRGRRTRVYVFPPMSELRATVERVVRVSTTEETA